MQFFRVSVPSQKSPASHGRQALPLENVIGAAWLGAMHGLHTCASAAPTRVLNAFPALTDEHGSHAAGVVAPDDAKNVPASHSEHAVLPVSGAYVPRLHGVQLAEREKGAAVPAGHLVHAMDPGPENEPGWHGRQLSFPTAPLDGR